MLSLSPVLVIATAFVTFVLRLRTPEWFWTAGMIIFAISAGLQIPMWLILGAAAGEEPRHQVSLMNGVFKHPFSLFTFWWRYVRQPKQSTKV